MALRYFVWIILSNPPKSPFRKGGLPYPPLFLPPFLKGVGGIIEAK